MGVHYRTSKMSKSLKIFLIVILIVLGLVLTVALTAPNYFGNDQAIEDPSQIPVEENENRQLIGGDRDEHGCIGSAGYIWCKAKQKCLRQWEEPCEEK